MKPSTQRSLIAGLTLVGLALIIVALLLNSIGSGGSSASAAEPKPVVLFWGTGAAVIAPASVSESCAAALVPIRKLVNGAAFDDDLGVSEVERLNAELLALSSEGDCTGAEFEAFQVGEMQPWMTAIPPTYDRSAPAVLSAACARATEPIRVSLTKAADGSADRIAVVSEADRAIADATSDGKCSAAEAAVFRSRDLAPAARRLGVSETGPAVGALGSTPTERAAVMTDVKLSRACRSALKPVETELFAAKSAEARSEAVSHTADPLTSGVCTQVEVDAFNATTQSLLGPVEAEK